MIGYAITEARTAAIRSQQWKVNLKEEITGELAKINENK